jgi:hypothetical protein
MTSVPASDGRRPRNGYQRLVLETGINVHIIEKFLLLLAVSTSSRLTADSPRGLQSVLKYTWSVVSRRSGISNDGVVFVSGLVSVE